MDGLLGMGLVFALKDEFSASADRIQAKMGILSGGADNMASQMTASLNTMKLGLATVGVGLAIASPFAIAIDKARDFEAQLSSIKSLGVVASDMEKLKDLAMQMGAETKFSALEAGQGIEELLKAGVSTADIMSGGLKGALDLAVAGELSVADAANVAATSLNAFGLQGGASVIHAANILSGAANASSTNVSQLKYAFSSVAVVANQMGMSLDDTSLALALLAKNTLVGSDAGTSFKAMLNTLSPQTKEATNLMKSLGLITRDGQNQFYTASGKLKSFSDMTDVLRQALKNLNPKQQGDALRDMFGSDGQKAAAILLKSNTETIKGLYADMLKVTAEQTAAEKLNNFNGAMEAMQGSIETVLIQVGQLFLPMLAKLVNNFNTVIGVVSSFVDTPIGKYFVIASAGVAVATIALGTFLTVSALARFSSLQLATSFASMGQKSISAAFAQRGMIGGLQAMATSAIRATIAMIPLVAKVILITAPLWLGYLAFRQFNSVLDGTSKVSTGFLGAMQQVGGVIASVIQIFKTWDGESFNLGGMEAQLESLGILDFVKNLSTWIVRGIELGKGFGKGFIEAFTAVKGVVVDAVTVIVNNVNGLLESFGLSEWAIGKATSSIQDWAEVGKYLAYVVVGGLTLSFGLFAYAVVAVAGPIIALGLAIYGIASAIYNWGDTMDWIGGAVNSAVDYMYGLLKDFGTWLSTNLGYMIIQAFSLPIRFVVWYWAQAVPFMISSILSFLWWAYISVPYYIGEAFVMAFKWVYDLFTVEIPKYGNQFSSFGDWLVNDMPTYFSNAFTSAFVEVTKLLTDFLKDIEKFAVSLGTNLVAGMITGINDVWGDLVTTISDGLAQIPGADYLGLETSGSGSGSGNVSGGGTISSINSTQPSFLGDQFAQLSALKNGGNGSVINNSTNTNNQAENLNINLEVDGNIFTKVVNLRNALENSRE
jgi:TP901 family phage tail tape measure protein